MVTIKTGDLFDATETVIGHQVNCFGVVGGLASAIFERYPDAHWSYARLVQRTSPGVLLGYTHISNKQPDGHYIANIFGQYQPGADYRPYSLGDALEELATIARVRNWSVALPYKLSCGICGGDWDEVLQLIEKAMVGVDCVIYRREGDE